VGGSVVSGVHSVDDPMLGDFSAGAHSVNNADFQVDYTVNIITTADDGETISPWSWWGGMNYYLSIIPYMGAEKAGLTNALTFSPPSDNAGQFCLTRAAWEGAAPFSTLSPVDYWNDYFKGWQTLVTKVGTGVNATEDDLDELRRLDWVAHTSSIQTSINMFGHESFLLPDIERQIALGWACFVGFIAETRLNVDFVHTNLQQPSLPQRILNDCDSPTVGCPPFGPVQQTAVATFRSLYQISSQCPTCFSVIFAGWKAAMTTALGRAHGRQIIEQTFQDFSTFFPNFKQLFTDFSLTSIAAIVAACVVNTCTAFAPAAWNIGSSV